MRSPIPCLVALAFATSSSLSAVGYTITVNDVTFSRTSYGGGPLADFSGVSATLSQDHVYHSGWWYRLAGDTLEAPFPDPDEENLDPGHVWTYWYDMDERDYFRAEEGSQLSDPNDAGPSGSIFIVLILKNLTEGPITLEIFHYLDADVDGTSGDDSATYVQKTPNEIIEVTNPGGDFIHYSAWPVTWVAPDDLHHQVAAYSGLQALLNDNDVDNLINTGTPFGAGDFTAAYQFSYVIPAHGTAQAEIEISVNHNIRCGVAGSGIFCDSFETGDRQLWGP